MGAIGIVLGKGFAGNDSRGAILSLESTINATAGLLLLQRKVVDSIVITGGKTMGAEWPSEGEAMKEFIVRKDSSLADRILVEGRSVDTHANAAKLVELFDEMKLSKNVTLVTLSCHMPRSLTVFARYGFTSSPIETDVYLRGRSPLGPVSSAVSIEKYWKLPQYHRDCRRERILRVIQFFDRDGKLLRLITRRLRHDNG